MSSGGGGSAPSQQTVTTVQQIPQFEQDFAHENQNLARSLGSQPFPLYQGPLVADFTPTQLAGQQAAIQAAGSWQPGMNAAQTATASALQPPPSVMAGAERIFNASSASPVVGMGADLVRGSTYSPMVGQGVNTIGAALGANPAAPGVIQSYMSPYVGAALAPQIQALNDQLAMQRRQIGAGATSANAFGDARQGAAEALNNFYGNQSLAGILGQGYNTAYGNALQTATQQQQLGLGAGQALAGIGATQQGIGQQAGQTLANIGAQQQGLGIQGGTALANLGAQQQALGLQGGQQFANLADMSQRLGLGGANAIYAVGQQQQQLQQQALSTAYQQYLNQVQWPYQQLNVRLSALSNSPYNMTNQVQLPQANTTASNLGMMASLAGLLGGATSGGSVAPFGGVPYNPSTARVG